MVRIVLVRLSALGDIVHTWPLACALAESDVRPHLSWVIEEPLKTLVEGHPAIDAVFTTRTGKWRRRPWAPSTRAEVATFKARLRELQPDLVIDPQGTTKSAMVVRWSKAERRVGLARPWRRELIPGLAYTETSVGAPGHAHVVATNLAMSRVVGLTPPELEPPDGSWPLRFDKLVQPVLDKSCVSCHGPAGSDTKAVAFDLGPAKAYENLISFADKDLEKLAFERDKSFVGRCPASNSKLLAMLTGPDGHEGVRLDDDSLERLITWMDVYAQRLGSFSEQQEQQLRELRRKWALLLAE